MTAYQNEMGRTIVNFRYDEEEEKRALRRFYASTHSEKEKLQWIYQTHNVPALAAKMSCFFFSPSALFARVIV